MIDSELKELSAWIDGHNVGKDQEAQLWGRVAKVAEEAGEAIAALVGVTAQNPRKGQTHSIDDVAKELLDVAVTALAAYAHVLPLQNIDEALEDHVHRLMVRAGLREGSS